MSAALLLGDLIKSNFLFLNIPKQTHHSSGLKHSNVLFTIPLKIMEICVKEMAEWLEVNCCQA